jgi:uncharacterized protein with HEPN domain
MLRPDQHRVRHIIDAAKQALVFAEGRSREDLDSDTMLAFALVRCIEIIGEAATYLSEDARAEAPQIPWRNVVGMRNRLIHGYFDVDLDLVWNTLEVDLPALLAVLEPLQAKYQADDS